MRHALLVGRIAALCLGAAAAFATAQPTCIRNGGVQDCSPPLPGPWHYNLCDARDYMGNQLNWCTAAGNPGCNGPGPLFPTEGSLVPAAQRYGQMIHGCDPPTAGSGGWLQTLAESESKSLCWWGGPLYNRKIRRKRSHRAFGRRATNLRLLIFQPNSILRLAGPETANS